jgi:hypothetical protein
LRRAARRKAGGDEVGALDQEGAVLLPVLAQA